jgi:hypothetical protein
VNDDDVVQRISDALFRSWRGSAIATSADQLVQDIAWEIAHLRAVGRDAYIKGEREAIARLRAMGGIEAYIKEKGEAWLASALLEAAERGLLRKIADLVDVEGVAPVHPGQYRAIQAYAKFYDRENQPPLIGELLRELGIDKPKRTKDNMQEWLKVNNRERVIRGTLAEFNLPLSAGKRGRPART